MGNLARVCARRGRLLCTGAPAKRTAIVRSFEQGIVALLTDRVRPALVGVSVASRSVRFGERIQANRTFCLMGSLVGLGLGGGRARTPALANRRSSNHASPLCRASELKKIQNRNVPMTFSEGDRTSYLAIASRACSEAVNMYTVISLGSQAYLQRCEFDTQ